MLEDILKNKDLQNIYNKFANKIPFPIREFVNQLGLTINEEPYRFTRSGTIKGKTITINKIHMEARKNFTIAHELAHYLLGHGDRELDYVNNRDAEARYTDKQIKEEETADSLAAELLMPEAVTKKFIDGYLKKHNLNELDSRYASYLAVDISEKFNVSRTAAILRLKDLNYVSKYAWISAF